ncbi:hypothetical protein [Haladaptatus sp. QDMS2]|uniref:hypothetical protein n=2 Tax=unclassified Haladaptatus TaxID=2622732 RepID=UPI0023E82075|nr:hypothetical protein [Haladaptatus sp. QDMS2]
MTDRTDESLVHKSKRVGRLIFRDRWGLLLFVVALWFFIGYWRIGIFISDTWTVVNAFVAVSEGHLWLESFPYGPGPDTPGMVLLDGKLYGRNYGQIFMSLPVLWVLQAVSVVADPRIAIVAGWSGLTLVGFYLAGGLTGRRTQFTLVGSGLALLLFAGNVALAGPLDPVWMHQAALQVTAMVAAALVGVVLYRLLTELYDRRVGLVTGAFAVLATPVGFWASIPKRHVFTTLFAVGTLYCFYRSREGDLRMRALAYVFVGLTASIQGLEALVLLLALGIVDLLTAPTNDIRTLSVLGLALFLSSIPFFATNFLISGNPFEPPLLLPQYDGGPIPDSGTSGGGAGGGGGGGGNGGGGSSGGNSPSGLWVLIQSLLASLNGKVALFTQMATRGIDTALNSPERLFQTYVRQGYYVRGIEMDGNEAINLSILESAPLLGALTAFPVYGVQRLRSKNRVASWLSSPAGATDVFVFVYCLGLTAVYLPNLPLHATITVRYLLPVFPFLLYAVMRLPSVPRGVENEFATLAWAYTATILVGGQLLVLLLLVQRPALGEAVQLHALLGIGVGLAFGLWAVWRLFTDRGDRLGAALFGLTAGVGTLFLLLSGIEYFAYAGDFALPFVGWLAEKLPLLAG